MSRSLSAFRSSGLASHAFRTSRRMILPSSYVHSFFSSRLLKGKPFISNGPCSSSASNIGILANLMWGHARSELATKGISCGVEFGNLEGGSSEGRIPSRSEIVARSSALRMPMASEASTFRSLSVKLSSWSFFMLPIAPCRLSHWQPISGSL
ncbi:hypothetical protein BU16DRAFT_261158 [Lophium mytilinum]|uniref:Uncharacterized protein n=1 Tax=Lophium mytilinum TaxID=390894 RepID=A0A6A6R3E2_9PEZI|nr:hypothetical protein BU16DRAFT_261158 [Lophium mytilinum]